MLGLIGGSSLLYGVLHTYAAATGGTGWMLGGALLVLYEFGRPQIRKG